MINVRNLLRERKKDKKFWLMVLSGTAGILLLLVSSVDRDVTKNAPADDYCAAQIKTETFLEKKTGELLASVAGVGKVRVTVTLDRLEEQVYAQDRTSGRETAGDEYVILKKSGAESGLRKTVILPRVRGVAVACEGGGSAAVRQEVTSLVCAALGVSANRVYVSRMGS